MAYCTVSDVKTWLNIPAGTTGDDTLLSTLIDQAQQTIDTYCNRRFEASADAEHLFNAVADVDGLTLYLDDDLCEITSVTNGDGTVLTATQYVTRPANRTPYYAIVLRQDSDEVWTYEDTPEGSISVVGRWAYSKTPPQDIIRACIRLTAWLYQQRDTGADVDRVMVSRDGLLLMPQQMPRDVMALLVPYRRY